MRGLNDPPPEYPDEFNTLARMNDDAVGNSQFLRDESIKQRGK